MSPGASDDTDAIVHRCLDQLGNVKVFVSEFSESASVLVRRVVICLGRRRGVELLWSSKVVAMIFGCLRQVVWSCADGMCTQEHESCALLVVEIAIAV